VPTVRSHLQTSARAGVLSRSEVLRLTVSIGSLAHLLYTGL